MGPIQRRERRYRKSHLREEEDSPSAEKMSDEERNEDVDTLGKIPDKLLEQSRFNDRSRRRLSLPLSGGGSGVPSLSSRKSSVASADGDGGGKGGRRRGSSERRRSSFGSDDSWSSYDSEDDLPHPRERAHVNSNGFTDFCVKNLSNADFGRREIQLAQSEMPGLMALRQKASADAPLKGAKVAGCTHINAMSAVMIETLVALGAQVRWCACNIFSTQNEVASALAEANVSVYAWRGQSEEDFWWCIDQCIKADNWQPNLVICTRMVASTALVVMVVSG